MLGLEELCRKWQRILHLQDWLVRVKLAPGYELRDNIGRCSWTLSTKTALIELLDPMDYPQNADIPYDLDECLVHELLHLHFAPFSESNEESLEAIAQEQAIDAIAKALVKVARQTQKEEKPDGVSEQ